MARYMYQVEVSHRGLNKYRIVKGATRYETERKANALLAQWNEQWNKKVERENRIKNDTESKEYAVELTMQAEAAQEALDHILDNVLQQGPFELYGLRDDSEFQEPEPEKPKLYDIPPRPQETDEKYNPPVPILARIIKKSMESFQRKNLENYEQDCRLWEEARQEINERNTDLTNQYEAARREWERNFKAFHKAQKEHNDEIDELQESLERREPGAIEKYISLALETLEIPINYDYSVDVEFISKSKSAIIELVLPEIGDIPRLKSVTYVKSRGEFKESNYTEAQIKRKYEQVIYQMVLAYISYAFFSDEEEMIERIVVNGRVHTVDKATGKAVEPCVLSVSVMRSDFNEINLEAVDAKAWFKSVRGIAATSIASVTPVKPVMTMSREDHRFREGYDVIEKMDHSTNLAAMDWKDFENLIREVFEMEFSSNGGEVKITQASRDGGVDAVAFDPDPIRGGKIVIQAKRYTNVVPVSAVRDLYGTVVNEGAIKGILVTTSDYGNDSFEFAKDKPITLLNGANLLSLLEKYGHKARIDLKEAKMMLK